MSLPSRRLLFRKGQVMIVDPLAFEFMDPGGAGRILSPVLVPVDVRVLPEHAGQDKRADIETDAVVEIGLPADGLFVQRLPANENIEQGLSLKNLFKLRLQDPAC